MRMKWLPELECWVFDDGHVGVPYSESTIYNHPKKREAMLHYSYPFLDRNGYYRVSIRGKRYGVHRLLAMAFIPNPQNKPTVDHIDRNPSNNSLDNLRWADHKEQADNTENVDRGIDKYGVRKCENAREYNRQWSMAHRDSRREAHRKIYAAHKAKGERYTRLPNGKHGWIPYASGVK